MRKIIGAATLIAALACSAAASEVPNGSPNPMSDTPTVIVDWQYSDTGTSTTTGEANQPGSLTADGAAELALDLLRSVLAFF